MRPLQTDEIIGRNQQGVIRKGITSSPDAAQATLPSNGVHRNNQARSDVLLVKSAGKG